MRDGPIDPPPVQRGGALISDEMRRMLIARVKAMQDERPQPHPDRQRFVGGKRKRFR
jgi:hypothetical protein